jgi:glucokinase
VNTLYVGVDIGGTKIAAGLVDAGGRLRRTQRTGTPPVGGGQAVLDAVVELVSRVCGAARPAGIGVGAPGVIDPVTGAVISATEVLPGWAGTPVRDVLQTRTGLPVTVDNDVRVMALGEVRAGAATGFGEVLFVSVGTGIGGALACHGHVRRGNHGTAGEIAHLVAGETGRVPCGCGALDHLEAVASGAALAAARRPDAVPHAATVLGRVLAGLVTALDVDAVVVGGGVAQIGVAFLDPLAAALHAGVLPPLRDLPVLPAALGADAPLVGAALLAADCAKAASR